MDTFDVERAVAIMAQVERRLTGDLADTVAWFEDQMPIYYKLATPIESQVEQVLHVHALRTSGAATSTVSAPDGSQVTVYAPQGPDFLYHAIRRLDDVRFHRVAVDGAADGSLAIAAFAYRPDPVAPDFNRRQFKKSVIDATCRGTDCIPQRLVERYLDAVGIDYLARSHPERIARHVRAWLALDDPEAVHVSADVVDGTTGGPVTRVMVSARIGREAFVHAIADTIKRAGARLHRFYCDRVPARTGTGHVLIASVYLTTERGRALSTRASSAVLAELQGLRRHFRGAYAQLLARTDFTPEQGQVLLAGIDLLAQYLPLDLTFLDVRDAGCEALLSHGQLAAAIADLVIQRFGAKPLTERGWARKCSQLREAISHVTPVAHERILEGLLDVVSAIRATNIMRSQRLGQAFLLDPALLPAEHFPNQAYAILYVHGRQGMGFQVRFRASARGGLRLILPRTEEQLGRVRDTVLGEVYALAWAQQLKNKDIPEGGSKCIALAAPGSDPDDLLHMVADGFLDLVVPPAAVPEIRGPHGQKREGDLLFLGPDENMTPERIVWVAERAAIRGLPNPGTFMSSKPGAGINHKQYGVTSEGVHAWLPRVLQATGVEPHAGFTVVLTGGPDGDVGGNLLKILHREYGRSCRVLGIADGSGAAYDPHGLDWRELLRLVAKGDPIVAFRSTKLSGGDAWVVSAQERDGAERRNHLHSSLSADVFLPCGGRPFTINRHNWQAMLTPDGQPKYRGMIEGANIFITNDARAALEDAGLVVIKDSSANKGGVITSSYEILAGLVVSDAEFVEIKETYVTQVVDRLRQLADLEADALLTAWRRRRGRAHLATLSRKLSEEIVRLSGLFEQHLDALGADEAIAAYYRIELERHCPPILVERFGRRLWSRIPESHRVAILAKRLASRMVYHEGLTWCQNYVPDDDPATVLREYILAGDTASSIANRLGGRRRSLDPAVIDAVRIGTRRELVRRQLGR